MQDKADPSDNDQMDLPDKDQVADLQKAYSEAISRTTKFLVSTAIISAILIIIVGQELREYRKKQDALAKGIKETALSLGTVNKKLDDKYSTIQKNFTKEIRAETTLEPEGLPNRIQASKGIEELLEGEQEIKDFLDKLR